MKFVIAVLFLVFAITMNNAIADDGKCVRNNCLGTCISIKEALGKPVPMLCKQDYVCYQDVECMQLDNGKCGWKETPQMKACLAEKAAEVLKK